MTTITFPSGFLWGAATAAHQIEGNNVASDLWEKEYAPDTTIKEPSGDACDSYNRFEEDIQLLADAELNTYRFSLEWARIEPVQGVISNAQLLHYRRMIEACQNRGVEPFVTLHHFSNPAWFTHNGGWKAGDAVELFLKYVETVKPILKDVNWICTINEPNMVAQDKNVKPGPDPRIPYLPPVDPQVRDTLIEAHQKTRASCRIFRQRPDGAPQPSPMKHFPAPTPMPHHLPRTVWMISSPQQPETITSACKHIKGSSSTRTVQYRRQTDWR